MLFKSLTKFRIKLVLIDHIFRLFSIFLIAAMGIIGLLIWFFEISVTAKGQGTVQCKNWVDIKPEINGIIREMPVREGQWVNKGTILFTLEERERKLDAETSDLKMNELKINIAKLENQIHLSEQNISAAINEARAAMEIAQANYRVTAKGPKPEEVNIAEGKILLNQKQLDKAQTDYENQRTAFELKLVSELEVKNAFHKLKITEVELNLAKEELKLLLNKYDTDQIAAAKAEVRRREALMRQAYARRQELEGLRHDLLSAREALMEEEKHSALFEEYLKLTRVEAPFDGYVLTHDTEHLAGKTVEQGTTVLRFGDSRAFIVDCRISEDDFPLVKEGQTAKVQIKPFPKGEYKLFTAEVVKVGADTHDATLTQENDLVNRAPLASTRQYPILLDLRQPYSMELFGKIYEIKPGFSAQIEVIIHKERIATYLIRRILRIKGKLSPENYQILPKPENAQKISRADS